MKKLLVLLTIFLTFQTNAQVKIGDNPTIIHPRAALEIESTNKGFILPRLTQVERDAIVSPANSMLIFNLTDGCINIYNANEARWKSICGSSSSGSASFITNCSSLAVSGTYIIGVALNPQTNFLTVSVNVTAPGTYSMVANTAGMYFAAAGTFTTTGQQDVVLGGQGYPLVAGTNFVALDLNGTICSTVITVSNGIATVTGCGTLGAFTGDLYTNVEIAPNSVYQSYTAGPSYTGGSVFGITSSPANGIRIISPLNGNFQSSGAPVDYVLSGTPLVPGNTTINYTINGFACSFTVPVQTGPGRASGVSCAGALAGTYQVGTAAGAGNTKIVTLTVSTPGIFNLRTPTVNGVYFAGSGTATSAGSFNITLTAVGTPATGGSFNYDVLVSSGATTFTSCSFPVTFTLPSTVPAFNTLSCASLSPSVSYIKASNTTTGDVFGGYASWGDFSYGQATKISADGLTLAVGSISEDGDLTGGPINSTDNNNWVEGGAVYIYTRTSITSAWIFQAKLKPSNLQSFDFFGVSLDISNDGNTLVVGAHWEDGSGTGVNPTSNESASDAGAAYVFVRSGTTWSQQAYLKANNTNSQDFFGVSVAISGDGNTVAVGASYEDGSVGGINATNNNSASTSGAVYTFVRSGSTWSFDSKIKASTPDAQDQFGVSVALNNDGTTLAVGAWGEDGSNSGVNGVHNNSAFDAGAAYVFRKTAGNWAQEAYIKASNVGSSDLFGFNVDVDGSGNTLVVSSVYEDGSGVGVNPAANDNFSNSGAAYVYSRSGATWTQQAYLKASNTGSIDDFGQSVSISNDGNFIVVGAHYEDGGNSCIDPTDDNSAFDGGQAYLFARVSGAWQSSFTFKMPTAVGVNAYDRFGGAVSISGDGKCIAIAASHEDGSGNGVNPVVNNSAGDSGCVIVYTRN